MALALVHIRGPKLPKQKLEYHFFYKQSFFRLRPTEARLLLRKNRIFFKIDLTLPVKKVYRVQYFCTSLVIQISIFSEIRVSKLAIFSLVLLIKVLLISKTLAKRHTLAKADFSLFSWAWNDFNGGKFYHRSLHRCLIDKICGFWKYKI